MIIPVVYAEDHVGVAPRYTINALTRLGHHTRRMTQEEYFSTDPSSVDMFWCQDSGEGIDFRRASSRHLQKSCWWSWDSRFNRVQRGDLGCDKMAKIVNDGGGWVFQAQTPDLARVRSEGVTRASWLPIGADPIIWSDEPKEEKIYRLSFVGNCYDGGRATAINYARKFDLFWPGPNSSFNEDAAKIYRQSKVVFHASTFYQLPHDVTKERVDFDLTMRPYEALACGTPFITNPLTDLSTAGFIEGFHYFLYSSLEEIDLAFNRATARVDNEGESYSRELRKFILDHHTYDIRVQSAFNTLIENGILKV